MPLLVACLVSAVIYNRLCMKDTLLVIVFSRVLSSDTSTTASWPARQTGCVSLCAGAQPVVQHSAESWQGGQQPSVAGAPDALGLVRQSAHSCAISAGGGNGPAAAAHVLAMVSEVMRVRLKTCTIGARACNDGQNYLVGTWDRQLQLLYDQFLAPLLVKQGASSLFPFRSKTMT